MEIRLQIQTHWGRHKALRTKFLQMATNEIGGVAATTRLCKSIRGQVKLVKDFVVRSNSLVASVSSLEQTQESSDILRKYKVLNSDTLLLDTTTCLSWETDGQPTALDKRILVFQVCRNHNHIILRVRKLLRARHNAFPMQYVQSTHRFHMQLHM